VVQPIVYQLTVTRPGNGPDLGPDPPIEWEASNPRFNGQKRKQNERYRH
jgi:hypothetical protein